MGQNTSVLSIAKFVRSVPMNETNFAIGTRAIHSFP